MMHNELRNDSFFYLLLPSFLRFVSGGQDNASNLVGSRAVLLDYLLHIQLGYQLHDALGR